MPYAFMIMDKQSTTGKVFSFSLSRGICWLIVMLVFAAPAISFYVAYRYIGAELVGEEVAEMAADLHLMQETMSRNAFLEAENRRLERLADSERDQRADLEARIAIVENARATSTSQMQNLEDEVYDLRRALRFYEAFVKPATEKEVLQCFNIKLTYKKGSLDYGVNFMVADRKNKGKTAANVKFRVLTGTNVLALDEAAPEKADHERSFEIFKDIHLKGKIKVDVPDEGLRVVDIKAYDKESKVIAHCWKAF